MSKEDSIEFEGKVVEVLSGGTFKVEVGDDHYVIAKLAGIHRYRCRQYKKQGNPYAFHIHLLPSQPMLGQKFSIQFAI